MATTQVYDRIAKEAKEQVDMFLSKANDPDVIIRLSIDNIKRAKVVCVKFMSLEILQLNEPANHHIRSKLEKAKRMLDAMTELAELGSCFEPERSPNVIHPLPQEDKEDEEVVMV